MEVVSGGPYRKYAVLSMPLAKIMDGACERATAALKADAAAELGVAFYAGLTPAAERLGYTNVACVVGRTGLQGFGCSTLFLSNAAKARVDSGKSFSLVVTQDEHSVCGDIVETLAPGADVVGFYQGSVELALADYQRQIDAIPPRSWD